ncbi:hypothetical protein CB1_000995040, partial [Camelus ferus]
MGAYPWGPAQPLLEADVYLLAQYWDLLGHDSHDSLSQLPAPRNLKVYLYNTQQALSWEPVTLSNDLRPVVYQVQHQ